MILDEDVRIEVHCIGAVQLGESEYRIVGSCAAKVRYTVTTRDDRALIGVLYREGDGQPAMLQVFDSVATCLIALEMGFCPYAP